MAEKPKWFRGVVEGGKPRKKDATSQSESKPEGLKPAEPPAKNFSTDQLTRGEEAAFSVMKKWKQGEKTPGSKDPSEQTRWSELIKLYLSLSTRPPANFAVSVRQERVQEAAKGLRSWPVDTLHKYLSGSEVWKRPSFTKAVFNEIQARMHLGDMSPRE